MRKLDLNVDLSNVPNSAKQNKADWEIAALQLNNGIALGSGRKNKDFHKKFYRITRQIDNDAKNNNGIVILGKADFAWVCDLFGRAEWPLDKLTNEIIVKLTEKLEEAEKVEKTEDR